LLERESGEEVCEVDVAYLDATGLPRDHAEATVYGVVEFSHHRSWMITVLPRTSMRDRRRSVAALAHLVGEDFNTIPAIRWSDKDVTGDRFECPFSNGPHQYRFNIFEIREPTSQDVLSARGTRLTGNRQQRPD
jgi:hypothetical protein